jgi:hypothetical protein
MTRMTGVWWRGAAAVLLLVSAALPVAARLVAGERGAIVHVRWQPTLTPAEREQLEARFDLADGERLDDVTWRYDLVDPSSRNIAALVSDAAVADTHQIDRPGSRLAASASRTARRQRFESGGDALVATGDRAATVLAAIAGALLILGLAGRAATPRDLRTSLARTLRGAWHASANAFAPAVRFLSRGIPEIDAQTAALFRIVFGTLVVAFFWYHRVDAQWLAVASGLPPQDPWHASVVRWLHGHPTFVDALTPALLAGGVAFTVGLFTRATYTFFVAAAIVWAYIVVLRDSTHPHSTLALSLVALLPSRWGDAWSIDSWLNRRLGRRGMVRAPGKHYGYSPWAPGLVFGIAFAAAAWAKLARNASWTEWILNGSIKYHFITDAVNAPVDWGLQFAVHPLLAITVSFAAVATEALVITAAFSRREGYRLCLGAAAAALLAGFWLFMGVYWAGWWILLLGFLPWQHLSRAVVSATERLPQPSFSSRITAAQAAAALLLIAQQVVISRLGVERAPMFTHYPMYSSTHASAAAFDASMLPTYRIIVAADRGTFELPCNASDDLVEHFRAALAGSSQSAAIVWGRARACGDPLADARSLTLEGDARAFDWQDGTLTLRRAAVVLGPMPAETRPFLPARAGGS